MIVTSVSSPLVGLTVDPSHNAGRVTPRPDEHVGPNGTLKGGHYYLAPSFTATAAKPAAGSSIFALQWTASNYVLKLLRVEVSAGVTTAFGTAQILDADIIKGSGWSTAPSGGTAVVATAGTKQVARTSTMGTVLAASCTMQISSGDLLTTGSPTLESNPFGYKVITTATSTVGTGGSAVLYSLTDAGQHGMIFEANEGFLIRTGINAGASGVVKWGFNLEIAVLPAY